MKARTVLLTFFIFSICCTNSFFGASAAEEEEQLLEAVLDTDGDKLQAGVKYYILPLMRGSSGGLTFTSFSNQTCSLSVVQAQFEVDRGHPITFKPAINNQDGVIRVSTDLNFIFSAFTICIKSNVWKLDYDESINKYIINIDGVSGNPGIETISNWFKIEKYEIDDNYYYKLRYCPTVCDYCKVVCKDVGRFLQEDEDKNEWRRLGLTDQENPFNVMFVKATSSSTSL